MYAVFQTGYYIAPYDMIVILHMLLGTYNKCIDVHHVHSTHNYCVYTHVGILVYMCANECRWY